VVRQKQKQKQT